MHRLDAGLEEPACVRNCKGSARYFGDLNNPDSSVSRLIAESKDRIKVRKEEFGTKPQAFYIIDNRTKLDVE